MNYDAGMFAAGKFLADATETRDSKTGAMKLGKARDCGCRSLRAFDCTALRKRTSVMNRIEPCKCLCH